MRSTRKWWVLLAAACWLASRTQGVPNASFEEGTDAPAGWQLEGAGAWLDRDGDHYVTVTGTGENSGYWRTTEPVLAPDTLYRIRFSAEARGSGGVVIGGPSFCNRDSPPAPGWQERGFVFRSPGPERTEGAFLRFGQWYVRGVVGIDDVRLSPTEPVHRRTGDVVLGEGEWLDGAEYGFEAPLGGEGSNDSRPLHRFTAGFNTNRWVLGPGDEVVYRHEVPGASQLGARVEMNCTYHTRGAGVLEASWDGSEWHRLARFDGLGAVRADLPAGLLPAETVYVRIMAADEASGEPGSFQVSRYGYVARLGTEFAHVEGATLYPDVTQRDAGLEVAILSAGEGLALSVRNAGREPRSLIARATVTPETGRPAESAVRMSAGPSEEVSVSVPLAGRGVGLNAIVLEVLEDGAPLYRAGMEQPLSPLDDASFGRRLPSGGPVALWWCEGAYKVSRTRPAPRESGDAVRLEAARNEYEPAQIVIRPDRDLRNVRVRVGHLSRSGEPQTRLPADNIAVSLVGYVNVTRPTDAGGARGYWPDPLPPFAQGTDLPAGRNHPLWLTVHVPPDQPAGRYEGEIILEAEGWRAAVPVEVKVWDFALPREPRLQTAFGLSHHLIRRYHNLETTEELRAVLDLYHRDCAAHRIAPYDPAPLDPIRVEFNAGGWTAGDYDASTAHAGQRSLRVTDDSPTSSIAASSEDLIPLDTAVDHHLSWWVKTQDEGQPYLVTLAQHDEAGQWIWGNNVDVPCVGSGRWEQVEALVPPERFNERTRFVGIALRPAPWSEEGEATGTAWFDDVRLAAEGRQENLVRSGDFELGTASLEAEVDFTAFDRQCERCLDELGFNTLMVGLRGMPGGTFYARRPGRAGPFEQGSAEYERLMASQGRQIVEHLRGKGWLGKAYCYWFDEPEPRDYAFVVEGMELLQRAAPGLTRMLTEQPEDELAGHVDLWCPVVGAVSREAIAERKRHGERLWWYLCTAPKTPYIGLFIDRPAVDLRAWAWLSRKWGIEGLLVWSANYWTSPTAFPGPEVQNPWDDPMSYVTGYGRERGQIGYWGNGDGRFLYPPNRDVNNDAGKHLSGPVSSLRWEMLREGVEDYDYFHLLAELARRAEGAGAPAGLLERARALAVVPDAVITDGRTYSNDPASLYAHRHRMAEVIEELSRTLRGEP